MRKVKIIFSSTYYSGEEIVSEREAERRLRKIKKLYDFNRKHYKEFHNLYITTEIINYEKSIQ